MAENETISFREFNRVQQESIHRKGLIKNLKADIEKLTGQIGDLTASNTKLTGDLTAAQKKAETDAAAIVAERDALQNKLTAAPSELQAELDKLRGEVRTRDHRDKFNQLAKDHIKPEALDAAWKLAGWKAESDDVNEAELGKAISALAESNPFLKPDPVGSKDSAGGAQSLTIQPKPAGPGATRGAVTSTGQAETSVNSHRIA